MHQERLHVWLRPTGWLVSRTASRRPSMDSLDLACPASLRLRVAHLGPRQASRGPADSPDSSWPHVQPDSPAEHHVSRRLARLPCQGRAATLIPNPSPESTTKLRLPRTQG